MRRIALALLALIFSANISNAQLTATGVGGGFGGAAAYQGPGDVKSGAIWWGGLRAYTAATRGTSAIQLCDSGGSNCADVATDAVTGNLNAPGSRGADNCQVVTTCVVKIIYDQTGGGHNCTQSNFINAPFFIWNGFGGTKPALRANGNTDHNSCVIAMGANTSQPFTTSNVAKRTGDFTRENWLGGTVAVAVALWGYQNTNNTAKMYAGTGVTVAGATDNTWFALQYVFNGASSDININGTANTVNPGTNAMGPDFAIMCGHAQGDCLMGDWAEAGIWSAAFTGGESSSMSNNQRTYWGF